MSTDTATVTHCDSNGTWLVALEGDHDLATRPQLERQTGWIWPLCRVAVVNLSDVGVLDSGVTRWLKSVERRLEAGGAVALGIVVGSPESVAARTFALMGARDWLACYATLEEALAEASPAERATASASAVALHA